ncbi:initiator RepB protein (plasmid) [Sulfuricurvum kujiense DSM 16994]|jgi:plasmid replication initiation protein|uniref:Initiator RepB protein n=1 Tax=Sulfuricurvum kujiense (strain ATCC BAA-921 / DSM 16994 / JCM 11577 / YK-1) TaxID=709032 RepID=E4U447_SULKY|nr:replication initiation protein [Sulfuricurvum kujiense]ADR35463.1 initiator RepB protein [Sulfuricurvum kujiense DSM 16994]
MNPREARELLQKQKEEEVKDLVKISNSLVEGFVSKSNAVALKMLFYIAKQQYKKNEWDIVEFTLSADDFAKYCNLDHRIIKDNIKTMRSTSVTFVERDNKGRITVEEGIVIVPRSRYDYTTKTIEITMFKKILDLILEVEERFTTIDVKNVMELESKYSIRMAMILEQIFGFKGNPENWDVQQQKKFSLDDLNDLFGTKYKNFTDFERKVLKPTKEEMDDKSEISFSYVINKGYNSPLDRGRPKALSVTIKLVQNKLRQRRLF